MHANDFEAELAVNGTEDINIGMLNVNILLSADDTIHLSKAPEDLQKALSVLEEYCMKWKLKVNTDQTKSMIFRNEEKIPNNINIIYKNVSIEIVLNTFCYLGIISHQGARFEAQSRTESVIYIKQVSF